MTRLRKRLLGGAALALVVGLLVFAIVTRQKTRLRLSYPPGEVTVTRNVTYVPGSGHRKHVLDVYAPKGAKNAPVVHFVHGGYWIHGDKDWYYAPTGLYGSIGEALARRGIVTVVQSYRLAPEVTIDGILDDVIAAVRWTSTNIADAGGDPKRIHLMGHSAGGHVVALIGADDEIARSRNLDPKLVCGYIPLSAVWDIAEMSDDLGPELNAKTTYAAFGRDRATWAARSPQNLLHPGMAPYFIVIGERDYAYMIPQAERARDKLTSLGMTPRFKKLAGAEHSGAVLTFGMADDALSDDVAAFVGAR